MSADAKPATDDALIGRKVGGYSITRRVGQGGMGVVYEAQHVMMEKRAAVKVLHKELSADKKLLQRFLNEAKASSAAHHTSIVSIFEYGQLDDGTAFIMMEFLDGEPLLTRMERTINSGKLMPLRLVVELTRQLAAALGVIHQKGIIHRDLKPENIFIVPDSVAPLGERVKLLDFGIAKVLDGKARKTTVGMILGTPLYMSPEQCEGSEDLDAKVDVYALGVLLYEMVCGHLPFIADTAAALMRQHMFKEPPPLEEQVLELPEDLCKLVHRMLAKPPADRPSMAEICTALEALLPQLGVQGSGQHSIIPVPNTGRRRQINISQAGEDSIETDPFASTMGGPGTSVAVTGPEKAIQPAAFATTLPDGERESKIEQVAIAQPINLTSAAPLSRARLPILLGSVVAVSLIIGLVAIRSRSHLTSNTPTAKTAAQQSQTPQSAPITPPKSAVDPKAAVTTNPSTSGDTDGDDAQEERKIRGKKGKKRGKKTGDELDISANKKAQPHSKSPADEADVWR